MDYICQSNFPKMVESFHCIHLLNSSYPQQVQFLVFRGHLKGVNSCCFMDNDNMIVSGSDDQTIKLWVSNIKSFADIFLSQFAEYGKS